MRARLVVACIAAALACGCKSKSDSKAKAEPVSAGSEQKAKPKPKPKPPDVIAEADARALFGKWLETQNSGDFDGYQQLFGNTMKGVKRAGSKTSTYDRTGWLEDRGRMFNKKMTVEAADVAVTTSVSKAVVNFTQTWSSGTYRDVGPKRLIIEREGDALRISSEEMLESQKIGSVGAWMDGLGAEPVKGSAIHKDVATALLALSARFQTDGIDPEVNWAQRLSKKLLLLEIVAEPKKDDDSGVAIGTLLMVRRSDGNLTVTSAASTPGGSSDNSRRDVDGDGIDDVFTRFSWAFDDYSSSGWALALTKTRRVVSFETNSSIRNDGFSPEFLGTDEDTWCTTTISGHLAIVANYHWETASFPEQDAVDEEEPGPGEMASRQVDYGVVTWVLDKDGMTRTDVFAHRVSSKPSAVVKISDTTRSPPSCGGGSAPTFKAYHGRATSLDDKGPSDGVTTVWSGFALAKSEADKIAKARGVPLDRVKKLGGSTYETSAPDRM